jgi:hypothetical protein
MTETASKCNKNNAFGATAILEKPRNFDEDSASQIARTRRVISESYWSFLQVCAPNCGSYGAESRNLG